MISAIPQSILGGFNTSSQFVREKIQSLTAPSLATCTSVLENFYTGHQFMETSAAEEAAQKGKSFFFSSWYQILQISAVCHLILKISNQTESSLTRASLSITFTIVPLAAAPLLLFAGAVKSGLYSTTQKIADLLTVPLIFYANNQDEIYKAAKLFQTSVKRLPEKLSQRTIHITNIINSYTGKLAQLAMIGISIALIKSDNTDHHLYGLMILSAFTYDVLDRRLRIVPRKISSFIKNYMRIVPSILTLLNGPWILKPVAAFHLSLYSSYWVSAIQIKTDRLARDYFNLSGFSLSDIDTPLTPQKNLSFAEINNILNANPNLFELNYSHFSKEITSSMSDFEKKFYQTLHKTRDDTLKKFTEWVRKSLSQMSSIKELSPPNLGSDYLQPVIQLGLYPMTAQKRWELGFLPLIAHWCLQKVGAVHAFCKEYKKASDAAIAAEFKPHEIANFVQSMINNNPNLSPQEKTNLIVMCTSDTAAEIQAKLRRLAYVMLGILDTPQNQPSHHAMLADLDLSQDLLPQLLPDQFSALTMSKKQLANNIPTMFNLGASMLKDLGVSEEELDNLKKAVMSALSEQSEEQSQLTSTILNTAKEQITNIMPTILEIPPQIISEQISSKVLPMVSSQLNLSTEQTLEVMPSIIKLLDTPHDQLPSFISTMATSVGITNEQFSKLRSNVVTALNISLDQQKKKSPKSNEQAINRSKKQPTIKSTASNPSNASSTSKPAATPAPYNLGVDTSQITNARDKLKPTKL